ncbi:armadillo-type protein [Hysterangium stoloniferum]|nr:armadillo-type protein [Hysterangium stoloniferum]
MISPASSNAVSGPLTSADTFQALKAICVPLLGSSLLTPEAIPRASSLLVQLGSLLEALQADTVITPSTIEYVFFPLSHILKRNPISIIPDVIMEKLMGVTATLFEHWWWSCQVDVWEQMLMLSAAIFCGIDSGTDPKGKRRDRDEETKAASARCIWAILHRRLATDISPTSEGHTESKAEERLTLFRDRARGPQTLPILGQTLTALLETSESANPHLQDLSLQLLETIISDYLPEAFIPSILPGVVSSMTKVALGRQGKASTRGNVVDKTLKVMQITIIMAVSDDICEKEGAVRTATSLEDIGNIFESDGQPRSAAPASPIVEKSPFFTPRTSVWLSATAAQLHIALNTLYSLLRHPNPLATTALSRFCHALLSNTSRSLPDSQALLLSFLLSLSTSRFPEVADASRDHLLSLLKPPSSVRFTLLQTLSHSTRDNLIALPRLLPSRSEGRVEHLARQVSAACNLSGSVHAVSDGVGKLLGPTGGIEKWGWNLLSVLEFTIPQLYISTVKATTALLEGGLGAAGLHAFPSANMKHVSSRDTREALDDMFRDMGKAAGLDGLFAVEWLVGVARNGRTSREVAALWCAEKILEGVGGLTLESTDAYKHGVSKRIEKISRWIAKVVVEFWEPGDGDPVKTDDTSLSNPESDGLLPLEYVKGLDPLITKFDLRWDQQQQSSQASVRPQHTILHKVFSLHLLSITSVVLRSRFLRLLLHVLYPILHSLVSENSYLSSTALATLQYITSATGYATSSNLLLANFDYALDGVARRLDRRQLDPEATKILVVLVRLVGKDIVSRAGDVVEACFDRLDEFHGYTVLVEGLVEVLAEVIKVVEADYESDHSQDKPSPMVTAPTDHVQAFIEWYQHRKDSVNEDDEDFGPAPRENWANIPGKGKEKETDEDPPQEPHKDTGEIDGEPPLTPTQVLTQQIVSHSIYFLTHSSALIRARVLGLLEAAGPTLTQSALLPSIHTAWPYILNRMGDSEPFVVTASASLIASLAEHVGEFMASRIWKDVWPRFRTTLSKLEEADSHSALARRGLGAVGTETAYSHSHRLYRAILRTMRAVAKGGPMKTDVLWEVLMAFRRFLHRDTHPELQLCAREFYVALMKDDADIVWLALSATLGKDAMGLSDPDMAPLAFMNQHKWEIEANAGLILSAV